MFACSCLGNYFHGCMYLCSTKRQANTNQVHLGTNTRLGKIVIRLKPRWFPQFAVARYHCDVHTLLSGSTNTAMPMAIHETGWPGTELNFVVLIFAMFQIPCEIYAPWQLTCRLSFGRILHRIKLCVARRATTEALICERIREKTFISKKWRWLVSYLEILENQCYYFPSRSRSLGISQLWFGLEGKPTTDI